VDAGPPTLAGLAHDGVGASVQAILASLDARPVCTGVTCGEKPTSESPKGVGPRKRFTKVAIGSEHGAHTTKHRSRPRPSNASRYAHSSRH